MKFCDWCGERLMCGEAWLVPLIGDPKKKYLLFHRECQMRQFVGSVAHLEGRCQCFVPGSTCTDPPEMTRREAARAAVAAWELRHSVSGLSQGRRH